MVLRQCVAAHALQRQQPRLPRAVKKQALLRAVAQVAFVVRPAARDALTNAKFLQQVLHLIRVIARHRQVVRAQRTGDAVDCAAPAVATGFVFQLQQGEVVHALEPQRAGGGKARHATASNHDAGFVDDGRCGPGLVTAQQMATFVLDAGEAARDVT